MRCLSRFLLLGLEPVNLSHVQGWVAMAQIRVYSSNPKRTAGRLDGQDPRKHWPRLTS